MRVPPSELFLAFGSYFRNTTWNNPILSFTLALINGGVYSTRYPPCRAFSPGGGCVFLLFNLSLASQSAERTIIN